MIMIKWFFFENDSLAEEEVNLLQLLGILAYEALLERDTHKTMSHKVATRLLWRPNC